MTFLGYLEEALLGKKKLPVLLFWATLAENRPLVTLIECIDVWALILSTRVHFRENIPD